MMRTRFAPSPTGYLHIGGVRTALFNWLLARQSGGQFILRIDDTDQQRNVAAALQPILDGFRWLGMDWDEGPDVGGPHAPYFQSQRADRHQAAVAKLLASGHAYRDFAKPDELQQLRDAARAEGKAFLYDRRWMATDDAQADAYRREGRSAVVRLRMPRQGQCHIQDLVRGDVMVDWASEQDHVIQRDDGTCLYHLASVVDDEDFQITHVVRAEEHLPNTPRQYFIAQSLGYRIPQYAHLPYVAEPGGTAKLSKRKLSQYLKNKDFAQLVQHGQSIADRCHWTTTPELFNPVIVDFYKAIGFLPESILNYLLLLGWSLDDRTERFDRAAMIQHFTLQRINKSPASFDPQKLVAFQSQYFQELELKKKVAMVLPYLQAAGLVGKPPPCEISDRITAVLDAAADRLKVAGDIVDYAYCFQTSDAIAYDEGAFEKRLKQDATAVGLLRQYRDVLASIPAPLKASEAESRLKEMLAERNAKIGQVIHALRVSITGQSVGFGMFETIELLGGEESLKRIDRALLRIA
jgi:glutamyl-tRNA synthetase